MPKNRIEADWSAFDEYLEKLKKVGDGAQVKSGVENALKKSKEYVNQSLKKKMEKKNLPAHGAYSTGNTEKSINKDMGVNWRATEASIDIGFDFEKSGITSIFLMYGTPRMNPVRGLKEAVYGTKAKKEITEIQGKALNDAITKIMEE